MTAEVRVPTRRRRRARTASLTMLLALGANLGCGREFFRQWADQDVSEAVFEKSRDPRWRLDMYSIEPPTMARFADPYDPDRPPAPPDDPAAQALSPVPQWPHHRLLTPAEGTGYLEMMEQGPRYDSPPPGTTDDLPTSTRPPRPTPAPPNPAPPPPAGGTSPFRGGAAVAPGTGAVRPNLGPNRTRMTPNILQLAKSKAAKPALAASPALAARAKTAPTLKPTPPASPATIKDPGVQHVAFQAPVQLPPRTAPAAPVDAPRPEGGLPPATGSELDPSPDTGDIDMNAPADPRARMSPESYRAAGAATTGPSAFLKKAAAVDEAEASGLAINSRPYMVNPAQAVQLALINSRAYQIQLEQIYLTAIPVTLQRFAFQPQFYAGLTPTTAVAGGAPLSNFANSFTYRTKEAPGGQISNLSLGTVAGVGKVFSTGGRALLGFANQTVFNFNQKNGKQPFVQSILPIQFFQPFLRGGGRAVTLEPLTTAERNLLYQIRNFARFRQQFVPWALASGQAFDASAVGFGDPSIGYLQVIQQLQIVSNNRETLEAFEQLAKVFNQFARGGGSGVSQINVDQINNSVQTARQSLVNTTIAYRNLLDNYKIQLGMPPDTPMVLDRGILSGFRESFDTIDDWFSDENRVPETLPRLVAQVPQFPDVVLDGRSLNAILAKQVEIQVKDRELDAVVETIRSVPDAELDIRDLEAQIRTLELEIQAAPPNQRADTQARNEAAIAEGRRLIGERRETIARVTPQLPELQSRRARIRGEIQALREQLSQMPEQLLLAAERITLENRLDLMNNRAQLYDRWRQLTVTANALLGIFNVTLTNQIFTPTTTTNPFAFVDQAKQFSLVLNAELPLVRVNERNLFRTALIQYRQQQRALMQAEDQVKLAVRTDLRALLQYAQSYNIQKETLVINLRNKDNTLRTILAPPGQADQSTQVTAQTQQLVQSQNGILGAQNNLIGTWVSYTTFRIALYADLGTIPYDEWEAYYEFFPATQGRKPGAGAARPGPAPAGAPRPATGGGG